MFKKKLNNYRYLAILDSVINVTLHDSTSTPSTYADLKFEVEVLAINGMTAICFSLPKERAPNT